MIRDEISQLLLCKFVYVFSNSLLIWYIVSGVLWWSHWALVQSYRNLNCICLQSAWFIVHLVFVVWQSRLSLGILSMFPNQLFSFLSFRSLDFLIPVFMKLKLIFFIFLHFVNLFRQNRLFSWPGLINLIQTLSKFILFGFLIILDFDSDLFSSFVVEWLNHSLRYWIQSFFFQSIYHSIMLSIIWLFSHRISRVIFWNGFTCRFIQSKQFSRLLLFFKFLYFLQWFFKLWLLLLSVLLRVHLLSSFLQICQTLSWLLNFLHSVFFSPFQFLINMLLEYFPSLSILVYLFHEPHFRILQLKMLLMLLKIFIDFNFHLIFERLWIIFMDNWFLNILRKLLTVDSLHQ